MIFDIFVKCNLVVTRWQQYSTHLHTNNTQKNTKQYIEQHNNLGDCGPCPVLSSYTLARVRMLTRMWQELEYPIGVCRVNLSAHIEHL